MGVDAAIKFLLGMNTNS